MVDRWTFAAILTVVLLAVASTLWGAEPDKPPVPTAPLTLSPDRTVLPGSGFVVISAKVDGKAKATKLVWGVVGSFVDPAATVQFSSEGDHAYLGIGNSEGEITVFAVAVLDGEPTPMVACRITIQSGSVAVPAKAPAAAPGGSTLSPAAVRGVAHMTIVLADTQAAIAAEAAVVNSPKLAQALAAAGIKLHVYDLTHDRALLTSRKLLPLVTATPAVVLQDAAGKVLSGKALVLPGTADGLLELVGAK